MARAIALSVLVAVLLPAKRMADGREWTTENLRVVVDDSYCYADSDANCRQYGRLYTWTAAQAGCAALGAGWRLPTDDEWRRLAQRYGTSAYAALMAGGRSGFDAVLGGDREPDGQYARVGAHGFYWTSTEHDRRSAVFYNFGLGGRALNRQPEGEKQRAMTVRCLKD